MGYHQLCEYAKKYGKTKAARKYQVNRTFVYRQLNKYDGTVQSLALQSSKPHNSPNKHTEAELELIESIYRAWFIWYGRGICKTSRIWL